MAKRKAEDDDDVAESSKVAKHSLDSDEDDDDAKKYEILDEDDIEGQEDATIEFDGDIKITPFNMKEELEEGHFDKDGNYFLNKDEDEVKDHWLDNIDWVKVKAKEADKDEEMDSDADIAPIDRIGTFKEMLVLMQPGETVLRAIKRLGKGLKSATASTRWNRKDKKKAAAANPEDAEAEELRRSHMLALTEKADRLLHSGNLVIYEATYEKLGHLIHMSEIKTAVPSGASDAEPLDMFGESFDVAAAKAKEGSVADVSGKEGDDDPEQNEVMWQFKWKNEDGAEVFGPHSSSQMQKWVDDGYFTDGVWVRKADQQNADFYTSKRIDFELYMS